MTADRPLTIEEAAAALGLTAEGVRSRLRRGTLAGERRGRTWYVDLSGQTGQPVTERPVTPDRPVDQSVTLRPVKNESALVTELRADVAYLRGALEREQAASAELRRLLAMHMPALDAPVQAEHPENAPAPVETMPKPTR